MICALSICVEQQDVALDTMSGRKILRRFSSSISDLLSIQKRTTVDETENGTPLHTAVQMGNTVMAQALLKSRAVWVDEEDGKGRTALHYAMEQNSTESAAILLKAGANVDCVDFKGTSACHLACKEGMIDSFNLLLYYRADICAVDKSGKTPFDLACEYGQDKMVECLLNCGVAANSFMSAGMSHKASALHLAARNGHTHIVLRLLENRWDLNRTNSLGSALHEAAGNGKAQVVRFLLHAGIDTGLSNSYGQTALDVARKNSQRNPITIKEIKFLLKEHKKFVYGEAVKDHLGVRADELSFSKGDLIWKIPWKSSSVFFWRRKNAKPAERPVSGLSDGSTTPKMRNQGSTFNDNRPMTIYGEPSHIIDQGRRDEKSKGVIFGQKANSRSGLFDSSAVKIVERPKSVVGTNMSNRMNMQSFAAGPTPDRKAKKFDIPIVPKVAITTPRNSAIVLDMNRNLSGDCSFRSVHSSSRLSDESNGNTRRMPLNTFGTDAQLSFGKNSMSTLQYASTSTISHPDNHRISTGSNCSQGSSGFESMKNGASTSSSASSFNAALLPQNGQDGRSSMHSSGSNGSGPSSLASCSVDALDESYSSNSPYEPSMDVTNMVAKQIPEAEILAIWLSKMYMSEYLTLFLTQGYDLATIARITPEDLLNVGVTNPDHRKHLIIEIHSWNITDSWPATVPPGGLKMWLDLISLPEYYDAFRGQDYHRVEDVVKMGFEDLEDVGIKRLGHLKRIQLAGKKIKDHRLSMASNMEITSNGMKYVAAPVQVHSPRLSARTMEQHGQRVDILSPRMNEPPPPAPSSFRGSAKPLAGIDYFSYSRGSRNAPPAPPSRYSADDYASRDAPSYMSQAGMRASAGSFECQPSYSNNTEPYLPEYKSAKPLKLHFFGNGQILSEPKPASDSMSFAGSTTTLDIPPAPAPVTVDNSIRRFQDACASSASISSTGSNSSYELPFANENCGTIRARDWRSSAGNTTMQPMNSSMPTPTIPTKPILKNSSSSAMSNKEPTVSKEDELNKINVMFDDLKDELDGMIALYNEQQRTTKKL